MTVQENDLQPRDGGLVESPTARGPSTLQRRKPKCKGARARTIPLALLVALGACGSAEAAEPESSTDASVVELEIADRQIGDLVPITPPPEDFVEIAVCLDGSSSMSAEGFEAMRDEIGSAISEIYPSGSEHSLRPFRLTILPLTPDSNRSEELLLIEVPGIGIRPSREAFLEAVATLVDEGDGKLTSGEQQAIADESEQLDAFEEDAAWVSTELDAAEASVRALPFPDGSSTLLLSCVDRAASLIGSSGGERQLFVGSDFQPSDADFVPRSLEGIDVHLIAFCLRDVSASGDASCSANTASFAELLSLANVKSATTIDEENLDLRSIVGGR